MYKYITTLCQAKFAVALAVAIISQLVYNKQLQDDLVKAAKAVNTTHRGDQEALVFNRVPKAGSEMMWSLIDKLANLNNFTSYSDNQNLKAQRGFENTFLESERSRQDYVDMWSKEFDRPFSYVKHLNFIDTLEFDVQNPIYFNIVRHPVDRVRSWYYYTRAPSYLVIHDQKKNSTAFKDRLPTVKMLKTTFEECVLNQVLKYTYPTVRSL